MQAHQNKGVPNREVRFQSMSRLGPFSDYFAANRSFIKFRIGLARIQESDLSTGAGRQGRLTFRSKRGLYLPAVSSTVSSHSALSNSDDRRNSVGSPPGLESTRSRRGVKSRGRNANCSMSRLVYLSLTKYSPFIAKSTCTRNCATRVIQPTAL